MSKNRFHIAKEDLKALLEQGDEFAFEFMYKLYHNKLLHLSINYLGHKENAQEMVQNVFLKLWQNMDGLTEIENINNYLFTLTKNACLNFLKREKVKARHLQSRKVAIDTHFLQNSTAALVLENELQRRIEEGIALLPEKCRKVFIKSRFEGLKNEDIAKMLAVSKRTVDNHIAKGIRHMRVYLKEYTALFLLFLTFD
ncbi:MAG: RNA polymerase sigma-70 factor [Bacteroidota bacterium]